MDLNLARRKREMAIAQEFAVELLNVSMPRGAEPVSLAHNFAVTCSDWACCSTRPQSDRVLAYTSDLIKLKARQVDGLFGSGSTNVARCFGNWSIEILATLARAHALPGTPGRIAREATRSGGKFRDGA